MLIKIKRSWELPDSAATDEAFFRDRRRIAKGLAAGSILAAGFGAGLTGGSRAARAADDPTADLYPVPRDEGYQVDRALSDESDVTSYNNFYEFGSHKQIAEAAQALELRPWQIRIDGLVEEEKTLDIDALIRAMPLEERVYRHRCVEAWAMTVPWTGFPFAELVKRAKPLSKAKYIRMTSLADEATMPGIRAGWYPWPYTEALTMEEATNDLAFLATGLYGKPLPKQNGAPLREVLPWKYGFKSIKSIVRFTFTEERPVGFWEEIQKSEYGFWANVNPDVAHPRWSQASERLLSTGESVPTRLFNGYGEQVAHLYKGLETEFGDRLYR
ncbi:protein-methionine-sulfoxide reductase catalytic subunit MsrP [Marivibrio halodurans]|uniref:Protein-methionine-sulfoxide reductase catalytic subunit MsrP n=1 Tax=Marivibrio halodurans TaxID=2039722 RepID=A0A8J7V1S6_9PROT|nr:protein-methionine-sulfoxide reductase catalytic subunit MsrP [Marivibrio halodurans]MBP5856650.1 protein-methionine-sulfoxide reductase catalytic subunit MsrP [Marivibrio halodurans]